jgi:predicted transcriptional regulator
MNIEDNKLVAEIKNIKENGDEIYAEQSAEREAFLNDLANAESIAAAKLSISVAKAMYKARKSAKLTQKELAAKLNTGQSYIAEVENGKRNITLETLERYAAACGKHIELKVI